jgi:dihydroxy-acid dehydratase
MPAGEYLGEGFHHAGGVPVVMRELLEAGKLHADALTVNGKSMGENVKNAVCEDRNVIKPYKQPMLPEAGFAVLSGSLFDSAVMKTSVVSPEFRKKYLERPRRSECL